MIFDLYFENNLNHIKELEEKGKEEECFFTEETVIFEDKTQTT